MKLYTVEFGWVPSGDETAVIRAVDLDKVKELITKENQGIKFVSGEPNHYSECKITEVTMEEEGVVYVGHFCC